MEERHFETVPSDDAITLQKLAEMVGRSYGTIYQAVRLGTLSAVRYANRWYVEPADAEAFVQRCRLLDRNKK